MATRAIITSQPDVACDVCGRRLLRGEHPNTFLAGGERRTVCELCAPRAAYEGWLRESDGQELTLRPPRRRRGVSLLGRLRQLRDSPPSRAVAKAEPLEGLDEPFGGLGERAGGLGDWDDGFLDLSQHDPARMRDAPAPAVAPLQPDTPRADAPGEDPRADPTRAWEDRGVLEAIEVFNAGEHPRRVAGVSRSLGEPTVAIRPLGDGGDRFTIVIAWELCWYRYEVDLQDRQAGARLTGKGMELHELAVEDRQANALADEHGEVRPLE